MLESVATGGASSAKEEKYSLLLEVAFIIFAVVLSLLGIESLPIIGEEPRRAEVAREMLATNDWLIPREQGEIYCSRPPLQNWLIAVIAIIRGGFDAVTVRLPSALATCATALVCFAFARHHLGRMAAITSGVAFLTMGQTLTIGQMGETDALFAFFVGSALLIWYHGYATPDKRTLFWALAGLLTGLGALTKALQAPVYYLMCTVTFLLIEKNYRLILSRAYVLSYIIILVVIAAWTVPYYLAVGPQYTWQIWCGQVESRLATEGLFGHILKYPLETFVCMLPWSLFFLAFLDHRLRESLTNWQPLVRYLVVSLLITFPTVWFIPEAKNRYFLPLYPLAAVLASVPWQYWVTGGTSERVIVPRLVWRLLQAFSAMILIALLAVWPIWLGAVKIELITQSTLSLDKLFIVTMLATLMVIFIHAAIRINDSRSWMCVLLSLGITLGHGHRLIIVPIQCGILYSPEPAIKQLAWDVPNPERLVSIGPIVARFRYFYPHLVKLVKEEEITQGPPSGVDHFCLEGEWVRRARPRKKETDRPRMAIAYRGGRVIVPKLPFAWDVVAIIPLGRTLTRDPQPVAVIGRIRQGGALLSSPLRVEDGKEIE